MKFIKKLTVIILAVAMVMSLAVTANAENSEVKTVNITVKGAKNGAVYTGYRILNTTAALKKEGCHASDAAHDSSCYNVGYTWNPVYKTILESITGAATEEDVYKAIAAKTSAEAIREFADAVYAQVKGMTADATVTSAGDTVTFAGVPSGYWLIVETIGDTSYSGAYSLVILDTAGIRDITIETKREELTLEKKVQDNGANYGTFADMEIGESAKFWILSDVPNPIGYSHYHYIIHDAMDEGLTFDPTSVVVEINKFGGSVLSKDYYKVLTNTGDGCAFHIEVYIPEAIGHGLREASGLKDTDRLYITYNATLNEKASILETGEKMENANKNSAWLEYSNNPYAADGDTTKHTTSTTPSDAYVWTFPVTVKKVDNLDTPLSGAQFVLSRAASLTEADLNDALKGENQEAVTKAQLVPLVKKTDGSYRLAMPTDANTTKVYIFDAGTTKLVGFDDQTDYYLYEIKAPDGYNRLKDPVLFKFTVQYEGTVGAHFAEGFPYITVGGHNSTDLSAKVINQTGTELPSTGGIGTTIFYILGGVMVLGAAVLLITKKRMAVED